MIGSGYIPTPAAGWPEIAALLEGKVWPEAATVTDLRWYVDDYAGRLIARGRDPRTLTAEDLREAIPGRPTLVRRWGWTDWKVKQLLRAVETWWDATRWGPPADRQPTTSAPPAHHQPDDGQTPTPDQEPPADRQPTTSAPPADRHARGDHPPPSTLHEEEQEHVGAPPLGLFEGEAGQGEPRAVPRAPKADVDLPGFLGWWNTEIVPLARKHGGNPPEHVKLSASEGLGKAIAAALRRRGREPVERVCRWFASSQHQRATFLREQGQGLQTLVRPGHWEEYVGFADLDDRSRDAPPAADRPLSPAEKTSVENRLRLVRKQDGKTWEEVGALVATSTRLDERQRAHARHFIDEQVRRQRGQ